MKIYFGSAISIGRKQYLKNYRAIVAEVKKQGHKVLSEYVVDPKLQTGDNLSPKKLFERETKTIDKCDLMIAEVTVPSWGTAFLMEHALKSGKPVLALFYKDAPWQAPMMVAGHPEFYVDSFDEDNLHAVLAHNFRMFSQTMNRNGKLIVIDGADGSGKATQVNLLLKHFKKNKYPVKMIDFPRYYTSFYGKMVGEYLKGDFGDGNKVSPYLSSLAYALDRATARDQLINWLKEGNIVIANRYTTSSMAFQTARVPARQRKKFLEWLYHLEYKEHRLPKENLVIFLDLPIEISQKLVDKKGKRKYLRGKKKDAYEKNVSFQKEVLKMYHRLAEKYRHWKVILCIDTKGNLLPPKVIHEKILVVLKERGVVG